MLSLDDRPVPEESVTARDDAMARVAAVRAELQGLDVPLLVSLMWIAVVLTALTQIAEVFLRGFSLILLPGVFTATITLGLIALLRRRRFVRAIAYGYIVMMWVSIAVPATVYGGAHGSISVAFVGNVLVAVSVVGKRLGFTMAGLSVLYLGVVYVAEANSWLPPPEPMPDEGSLLIMAGLIVAAALVVARALSRADRLVRKLDETADQLEAVIEERTQNLQTLNARLIDENSRRKATEAELVRARNDAESAARAKSAFLANMSHEIRTPMNAVVAGAELLEKTELPADARELADAVSTGARSLLGVVNDVLDLNKIEAGAVELIPEVCQPREILEDVQRLFVPLAQGKGLELEMVLVPALERPVSVDAARLRQVIANLVGNAVKFTDAGQVKVSADLVLEGDANGLLKVDVSDTGPGLPEDQQEAVFEAFAQADHSLTRRHAGSGLGLAICSELVDLMGGELGVSSRPGEGATFSFSVPVELADEAPREEPAEEMAGLGALRVLVAEDVEVNRMLTQRYLSRLGVEADMVDDGAKAVEAAKAVRYDVILMDLHMPVLDGFEATKAIREQGLGRPRIVAFTADMMSEGAIRARAVAMDAVLPKPVTEESLRLALNGGERP